MKSKLFLTLLAMSVGSSSAWASYFGSMYAKTTDGDLQTEVQGTLYGEKIGHNKVRVHGNDVITTLRVKDGKVSDVSAQLCKAHGILQIDPEAPAVATLGSVTCGQETLVHDSAGFHLNGKDVPEGYGILSVIDWKALKQK